MTDLEGLATRAATGDAGALDAFAAAIEPWLVTLVEDQAFVGRLGQRPEDRDTIVSEVISRVTANDAKRLKLYVEMRPADLDVRAWLRVVANRVGLDYMTWQDNTSSIAGRSKPSPIALELLLHAAGAVAEPALSALELWAQGASTTAIARELDLDEDAAEELVRAALERVRVAETARAADTKCRGLVDLESKTALEIGQHVAECSACRLVVDLLRERRRTLDANVRDDECARADTLLAARLANHPVDVSLEQHLRGCETCRTVAATLSGEVPRSLEITTAMYAIGEELARGGMGRILRAEDLRIGRPVAVKEMLGTEPAHAARFDREARVTARLQHPGIVPIYEIGKWPDGTPFYTMRLVEGRTLRDVLSDKASMPERMGLLPSVIAAADAVAFAHGRRIIHRDLTPNNVLIGSYGDTVVIDWGLAKDLSSAENDPAGSATSADGLTSTGAIVGTAAYMPPEQARGDTVDERADVYALGAMLYHVLSGEKPYSGESDAAIRAAIVKGPPRPLGEVSKVPIDLVTIVAKAMSHDREQRYQNAKGLADELRKFQTGQLVSSHQYTMWQLTKRFARRYRAAIGIASILLSVLAIVIAFSIRGIVRARDVAEERRRDADTQRGAAETAADRAEHAEAQVKSELDQLRAAEAARMKAESEVRAKGTEVQMSKEQLAAALVQTEHQRELAEQAKQRAEAESARAKDAELRSVAAASSEKKMREDTERLYEAEKARVKALESAPAKGITTELSK